MRVQALSISATTRERLKPPGAAAICPFCEPGITPTPIMRQMSAGKEFAASRVGRLGRFLLGDGAIRRSRDRLLHRSGRSCLPFRPEPDGPANGVGVITRPAIGGKGLQQLRFAS